MKKLLSALSVIVVLLFFLRGCDDRPEHVKLVHRIMNNVTTKLEHRYPLRYIGMAEGGEVNHYKIIGLMFQMFRVTSKDEGRKILVEGVEELLNELNTAPLLENHLQPYPFAVANIEMAIYVYYPDGKDTFYPDISIFSVRRGIVRYVTDTPESRKKYQHYTEETESYEEAARIVHSQTFLK